MVKMNPDQSGTTQIRIESAAEIKDRVAFKGWRVDRRPIDAGELMHQAVPSRPARSKSYTDPVRDPVDKTSISGVLLIQFLL